MKIEFPDKSFIDCQKNDTGKIVIVISAKDGSDPNKRIVNAVELEVNQFKEMISNV